MATWVMHLRIAEYFLDKLDVDDKEFIVGNIAPDSGVYNPESGRFEPDVNITHFLINGDKNNVGDEKFFNKYLKNHKNLNKKQFLFYLGYYIHLLTDNEFSKRIGMPSREKYKDNFEDENDYWIAVKRDWYDLDNLYLRENKNFKVYEVLKGIESFPSDYLDYYSNDEVMKKIRDIVGFYSNYSGKLDREYFYLTYDEVDRFIDETVMGVEVGRVLNALFDSYQLCYNTSKNFRKEVEEKWFMFQLNAQFVKVRM